MVKVNVIAWLEFELAYLDIAVHSICHYASKTLPISLNGQQFLLDNKIEREGFLDGDEMLSFFVHYKLLSATIVKVQWESVLSKLFSVLH